MKRIHVIALAAALVAVSAPGTAVASATRLFSLDGQTQFFAPTFGTSVGTVLVDDGSLTGVNVPPGNHLLLDTQGTSDTSGVLGSYAVPANPASVSYFQYAFVVAAPTTFFFNYNFLTNTSSGDSDFFVAALFDASRVQTMLFSESSSSSVFDSGSGYLYETGFKYKEFTVAPGNYVAEFVLGTNQAGCLNFGLCIPTAGILNTVPGSVIPEPSSIALVGLALLGLARSRVRRA